MIVLIARPPLPPGMIIVNSTKVWKVGGGRVSDFQKENRNDHGLTFLHRETTSESS